MLHALFMWFGLKAKHETANARQATGFLPIVRMGRIEGPFAIGTFGGIVLPSILLGLSIYPDEGVILLCLRSVAAAAALCGLFFYKYAYVRSAQLPPLS